MSITRSDQDNSTSATGSQRELVLAASELTVRVGNAKILDRMGFEVGRGEHVAVLGHNGAGKTSMLRAVLGLFRKNGGRVTLFGKPAKGRSLDVLARTGALLGTPAFYENMSVRDHLHLTATLRCPHDEVKAAVVEALRVFDLYEHRRKHLKHCSSGMRKRVAMACAFMGKPDLLFLDDPTAELDAAGTERLRDMIRRIRERNGGASLILATHSLSLARELGDRVVIIDHGEGAFDGTWEAFDSTIGGLFEVTVASGDDLCVEELRDEPYVLDVKIRDANALLVCVRDGAIGRFVATLVRCGAEVTSVVPVPFSSEEFIERLESVESRQSATALPQAEVAHDGVAAGVSAPRHVPSLIKRLLTSTVWEAKVLLRSATLWIIPLTLVVCAVLGLIGAIPAQEKLLAQQVTMSFLITSSLALSALLGSIVMAIAAGIAICTDYSQNRLRFLFVLPLRNRDMLFSKVLVWNVLLPIYVIACVVGIPLFSCFIARHFGKYPWSEEGFGLPPGPMVRELVRYVPAVFVSYAGIGLLSTAMGVVFRRTQVVLTVTVLLLV
ncbi:MAG: ABC transporter ATP-binding protein, partial [Candidatus Hydrogenedentes bacterium]|nr:ABC transporter ATP-binding protein [Candidatus Hydrogenedentota bacterium]